MSLLKPVFLVSLFLSGALLQSQPAQDSPELKEASDLTTSVAKLMGEQKYNEALPLAKRALEIRERLLPRDDPRIGNSLIYLAGVYGAKKDNGKAKETLERLLQFQTERFGADNARLAPTLERLAVLYFKDDDYSKTEAAYKRALALKEKEYGNDHVEVAHTLYGLGQFYRARGDFESGSPVYRRALRIYAKHSGVSSTDFSRTRDAYSCMGYETNSIYNVWGEINSIFRVGEDPNRPTDIPFGAVLNGKAISLPKPEYTAAAKEHRESGTVIVRVTIDETGTVVEAVDQCGAPQYISQSALKAAYKARFTPTKISGKPITVTGVIQYNFVSGRR